jgi:putative transposase
VHDRFQEWEQAGFFKAVWQAGLSEYDDLVGIQWEWQAADGVMTKAPFGNAATGANPTDRAKRGTKRSLLTDGAGITLALVVDGANRHDVKLVSATLDGLVISRPEPTPEQPQHLCLDAAYDSTPVYQELLTRHYQPHVRSRGKEKREKEITPGYRARRPHGGTEPFLDQSLAPSPGAPGKEGGELSGFPASGLCSTHLRQGLGFRISCYYI